MITEVNALEYAQNDGRKICAKIEKGILPDDISRLLTTRLVRRVDSLQDERASARVRAATQNRITASTLSEYLCARTVAICMETIRGLPPEDSRALLLWTIGAPPQIHGVLGLVIQAIGETSGPTAVQQTTERIQQTLTHMQGVDEALFGTKIKVLPRAKQRIIKGLILDAQWAFQERDGISARARVITARKVALRWLKEHRLMQATLGTT